MGAGGGWLKRASRQSEDIELGQREQAREQGVLVFAFPSRSVRCVTHLNVNAAQCAGGLLRSEGAPMKLFVLPGSCALACHIALEWADAAYELELLGHDALRSERFLAVNPKAKVPAPAASDLVRRAKLNETLSELTSEVHPAFGPLFAPSRYAAEPGCEEAVKRAAHARVDACFVRLDAALGGKDWLLGERSVADPYLYALSRWLKMTPKPVESYPAVARHHARMASDPDVRRALAAEGLDA